MQGPRVPSHRASKGLALYRLDRPGQHQDDQGKGDDKQAEGESSMPAQETAQGQPDPADAPEITEDDVYPGRQPDPSGEPPSSSRRRLNRTAAFAAWARRHARFIGPGLIASAAYVDPGNYATNLQAGATNGYKLLFIVLLSGLIGIMMQILSARLGIVTGKDIGEHCRQVLHSRPRHTMRYRWGLLYPLYVIAEAGIIFTDLAELLGTAIAFNLLIPKIPLYAGVLLTSLDVFVVLIVFNSYPGEKRNKSIMAFEILISALVLTVLASFAVLIARLQPQWSTVFHGYLPSSTIVGPGALYISVGIIGATVMPHALFLGAKLGTIRRLEEHEMSPVPAADEEGGKSVDESQEPSTATSSPALSPVLSTQSGTGTRVRSHTTRHRHGISLQMPHPTPMPQYPLEEAPTKIERTAKFVRTHLHHAQLDIAYSLFCFALVTNSAILIMAGAAFYYGEGSGDESGVQDGDLFSAHSLIKERVGSAFAFLFALALMMSGQAASITATLAGQIVSEGFIHWRTTPWKRRLITRCISMVPSLVVAVSGGQKAVNTLLVASQVTLSLVLPFVLGPLIVLTCRPMLMSVSNTSADPGSAAAEAQNRPKWVKWLRTSNPFGSRSSPDEQRLSFANNFFIAGLACAIFVVVCIADVYALVQLGMGQA